MDKTYEFIKPQDVYRSLLANELSEEELWNGKSVNEYGNYVSRNDFIDLFAGLIRKYGYRPAKFYAKKMGVAPRWFAGAIMATTGMLPLEWIHTYLNIEICELIEKTDLQMTEIAKKLEFSPASLSRFFKLRNKMQPYEYMTLKRSGKRHTYQWNNHY